jgi:hypothetical protein
MSLLLHLTAKRVQFAAFGTLESVPLSETISGALLLLASGDAL